MAPPPALRGGRPPNRIWTLRWAKQICAILSERCPQPRQGVVQKLAARKRHAQGVEESAFGPGHRLNSRGAQGSHIFRPGRSWRGVTANLLLGPRRENLLSSVPVGREAQDALHMSAEAYQPKCRGADGGLSRRSGGPFARY